MAKIAKVQEVDVEKLKPYERNAKIHNENQIGKICDSIREFGFISPCLIDADYNVIAGHGRIMAAKELKLKKVPCLFVEGLTDEQRRAYILADNRLTELGYWDMGTVEAELSDLEIGGFDISLTGFDNTQIEIPENLDMDEQDETDHSIIVKFKFADYKDYIRSENRLKEIAEEVGAEYGLVRG